LNFALKELFFQDVLDELDFIILHIVQTLLFRQDLAFIVNRLGRVGVAAYTPDQELAVPACRVNHVSELTETQGSDSSVPDSMPLVLFTG
jgi:hypothetical protein